MINLDDYFLGVIIPDSSYYKNPNRVRNIGEVSFDPFSEMSSVLALTMGVPTLLHKVGDVYYDEYYSRWKNELGYKEAEVNSLGIILAFVKPFSDYYDEKPTIYIKEEVERNTQLMEDIFYNHSYYIAHSKLDKSDAIVTIDEEPMEQVRSDYFNFLLEKSGVKQFTKR